MFGSTIAAREAQLAADQARARRFQVFSQLLWIATATIIGWVIHKNDVHSIPVLGLGLALGVLALTLPGCAAAGIEESAVVVLALVLAVAFQFSVLLTSSPAIYLTDGSPPALRPFQQGVAVAAVLTGALAGKLSRGARISGVAALLLVHFALGVWLIRASPNPHIDVFVLHKDAMRAVLEGGNPYAITSPNIYPNADLYGPGMVANGKLTFGYPYPPLSLFLGIPGLVLFGDPRYSLLIAFTATGACLAGARLGRVSSLAVALYLFSPRTFFVLEQSWIEPFVVLMLALLTRAATSRPKLVPWLFGLLLSSKQYIALFTPLGLLLLRRPWKLNELIAFGARAGVCVALLVTWFIWLSPTAFVRSIIVVQASSPFRPDSLSFPAMWVHAGAPIPPAYLGFAAAFVAMLIALWRAPRTPAGFAGAIGICAFTFFAYGKLAFCNYHFFVIGAICCTLALSVHPEPSGIPGETPPQA